MELEPSGTPVNPPSDPRPRLPEPLPVRLVAVEDVTLISPAGLERDLDAFYVGLLGFLRDASDLHRISYHAENLDLHLAVREPPLVREDLRMLGVEVPSLRGLERRLIES